MAVGESGVITLSLLVVENLSIRFGGLQAVKNVSFCIDKGQIVSLIGPNGAGKTTIFNIIAGVYRSSEGTIRYQGINIKGWSSPAIAKKGIIRTFQTTSLFPGVSVLENILIGRHRLETSSFFPVIFNLPEVKQEERRNYDKTMEILSFLGLAHRKDELARNLPYGEQRLLEIGIALSAEPELLMLDEPAAGLNPTETNSLMQLIRTLQKERITIFLVEHDMRLVMNLSEKVVVICNGEKIAEGRPQQIQQNEQVVQAYLGQDDWDLFTDERTGRCTKTC